jgi:hypothetical protein
MGTNQGPSDFPQMTANSQWVVQIKERNVDEEWLSVYLFDTELEAYVYMLRCNLQIGHQYSYRVRAQPGSAPSGPGCCQLPITPDQ